jgi:hypothetical protein
MADTGEVVTVGRMSVRRESKVLSPLTRLQSVTMHSSSGSSTRGRRASIQVPTAR